MQAKDLERHQQAFDHLIKDAPGLKEKLNLWLQDENLCAEAKLFSIAVNAGEDYQKFKDYPQLALIALSKHVISMAQFSSVTLQWSASLDFDKEYANKKDYILPKKMNVNDPASKTLREFLTLYQYYHKVAVSDADFKEICRRLSEKNVQESERRFSVLLMDDFEKITPIMNAIAGLGFRLFMPVYEITSTSGTFQTQDLSIKGTAKIIVPSLTIIQTVIDVVTPGGIQLTPRIGESSEDSVFETHQNKQHILGLSFPGYLHDIADGVLAGNFGFSIHDVYHCSLLSAIDILVAINHMKSLGQDYLSNCSEEEVAILRERLGLYVDAEFNEYFLALTLKTPSLSPENMLIRVLARLFYPINYLQPNAAEVMLAPEKIHSEFATFLLINMMNQSDEWQSKFGIDIRRVISSALYSDHVIFKIPESLAQTNPSLVNLNKMINAGVQHFKMVVKNVIDGVSEYQAFLDPQGNQWRMRWIEERDQLFHLAKEGNLLAITAQLSMSDDQLLMCADPIDIEGKTPLFYAVLHGYVECAEMLIKAGAVCSTLVDGKSLLSTAISANINKPEMIRLMLLHVKPQSSELEIILQNIVSDDDIVTLKAIYESPVEEIIKVIDAYQFHGKCEAYLSEIKTFQQRLFDAVHTDPETLSNVILVTPCHLGNCLTPDSTQILSDIIEKYLVSHDDHLLKIIETLLSHPQYSENKAMEKQKTEYLKKAILQKNPKLVSLLLSHLSHFNSDSEIPQIILNQITQNPKVYQDDRFEHCLIACIDHQIDLNLTINYSDGFNLHSTSLNNALRCMLVTSKEQLEANKQSATAEKQYNVAPLRLRRLLVERGLHPNTPDIRGGYELDYAVEMKDREYIQFLMDHDADPEITITKGTSHWLCIDKIKSDLAACHHFSDYSKNCIAAIDSLDVNCLSDERSKLLGKISARQHASFISTLIQYKLHHEMLETVTGSADEITKEEYLLIEKSAMEALQQSTSPFIFERLSHMLSMAKHKTAIEMITEEHQQVQDKLRTMFEEWSPTLNSTRHSLLSLNDELMKLMILVTQYKDKAKLASELQQYQLSCSCESLREMKTLTNNQFNMDNFISLLESFRSLMAITVQNPLTSQPMPEQVDRNDIVKILAGLCPIESAVNSTTQLCQAKILDLSTEFFQVLKWSQKPSGSQFKEALDAYSKITRLSMAGLVLGLFAFGIENDGHTTFYDNIFSAIEDEKMRFEILDVMMERLGNLDENCNKVLIELANEYCDAHPDTDESRLLHKLCLKYSPVVVIPLDYSSAEQLGARLTKMFNHTMEERPEVSQNTSSHISQVG